MAGTPVTSNPLKKPKLIENRSLLKLSLEYFLVICVLAGVVYSYSFFRYNYRLPSPFIFDTFDTFMDWFNTAYWSHNGAEYSLFRSVYPPISFVVLRYLGNPLCYLDSPGDARDCDWFGIFAIFVAYIACVISASWAFFLKDRTTAIVRSVAVAFGLPLLFTLERGNLVLLCFPFFVLAHGPFRLSPLMRGLSAAITINFKPYLVIATLAWLVRRRWSQIELAGLLTLGVYLVTYAANGGGSVFEIAQNTRDFLLFQNGLIYEALYYSTSYSPFLNFDTYLFPTRDFISTYVVDAISFWVPKLIVFTQAFAALTIFAAWLQPQAVPHHRLAAIFIGAYLVSSSPGGYSTLFFIFLVFLEDTRRLLPFFTIVLAYVVSVPFDLEIGRLFESTFPSWLAGRETLQVFGITAGSFARPGVMIIMVWSLALDTLLAVAHAHRTRVPSLFVASPGPLVLSK